MSIVPLLKAEFVGRARDRDAVLELLQAFGASHVASFDPKGPKSLGEPDRDASREDARKALAWLASAKEAARPEAASPGDAPRVIAESLSNKYEAENLGRERAELEKRIEEREPLGEFAYPREPLRAPSGEELRFWFFKAPRRDAAKNFDALGVPWQIVAGDARDVWAAAIAPEEPKAAGLKRVHAGAVPLSGLRARLSVVDRELARLAEERVALAARFAIVEARAAELEDAARRELAARRVLGDGELFALRCWIPADAADDARRIARDAGLALLLEPAKTDDAPPTLLRNPESLAAGEELVTLYRSPAPDAWDPSILVFFSFALFYAMILSDAGYGLMMALPTLFFWRKLGRTEKGRRGRSLLAALGLGSIAYGVAVGSYFGVAPSAGSWPDALRLFDANDSDAMLKLSINVGAAHLIFANLIAAFHRLPSPRALAPLGWAAAIAGGMAYATASPESAWSVGGKWALIAGPIAVFLFSSARPFPPKSLGQIAARVGDGLLAVTDATKAFGDLLSYMRLFALGLSSATLALTFNALAGQLLEALPPVVGHLAAALLLVFGHALNFALGIMGGVIHGLRLNWLEFFNWCLADDGYPFQSFRKRNRAA